MSTVEPVVGFLLGAAFFSRVSRSPHPPGPVIGSPHDGEGKRSYLKRFFCFFWSHDFFPGTFTLDQSRPFQGRGGGGLGFSQQPFFPTSSPFCSRKALLIKKQTQRRDLSTARSSHLVHLKFSHGPLMLLPRRGWDLWTNAAPKILGAKVSCLFGTYHPQS